MPTIWEMLGFETREQMEAADAADAAEAQAEKGWPVEESCPGCDGHRESGPHRLSCTVKSGRWVVPVRYVGPDDA